MSKQLIPTKLYKDISNLLIAEKYFKEAPPLKWTNNSKTYGYLKYRWIPNPVFKATEAYLGIYINKNECPCTQRDFNRMPNWSYTNFLELVDTICHELAHMKLHEHNEAHTTLTKIYKELVTKKYNLDSLDGILDYIKDCKEK